MELNRILSLQFLKTTRFLRPNDQQNPQHLKYDFFDAWYEMHLKCSRR